MEESASYSDGWGCLPSLQFGLSPNYSRGNGGNGNLLPKGLCQGGCNSVSLIPQQATVDPSLHRRFLETHRRAVKEG